MSRTGENPGLKGHIVCDCIYMKCPEGRQPEGKKAEWWVPEPGEKKGQETTTYRALVYLG